MAGGLEPPATIAAWEAKYEHYVSLHRDEVGGAGSIPSPKLVIFDPLEDHRFIRTSAGRVVL
ncbi:MAG: hypothetical protein H0X43_10765 [Nitrosospira sp.]|nr:hypothetical protein [Nitrosospira sp.]